MLKRAKALIWNLSIGAGMTCGFLVMLEMAARCVPPRFLPPGALVVPLITPVDRGQVVLHKNGYRGRRACGDCPQKNVRIVTMGGSSTFGVPMRYSAKTYTAQLQKLFDTRRPGEHYEVLNGGIAGFGIWQIVEALERQILVDKPDIVMLCAWYNDSSGIPGWYGFPGLSDQEAYEKVTRLRWIESLPVYQLLRKSRAYGIARFYLQPVPGAPGFSPQQKRQPKKRRSSPDEFRAGVERFLALAKEHQFLPIFVTEALNRTTPWAEARQRNHYYRVLEELARRADIPIVDTLTPLAARSGEWLFYDFIHPNEHGHGVIAEAIYQSLFDQSWHTQRSRRAFEVMGIQVGKVPGRPAELDTPEQPNS